MAQTFRSRRSLTLFSIGVLLISATALVAFAATRSSVGARAYVEWMRSPANGQRVTAATRSAEYTLQYKTREYVAVVERHLDPDNTAAFRKALSEIEDRCDLYTLTIKGRSQREPMLEGLGNDVEYYERAAYYTLAIEQDLLLVQGTDSMPPIFVHAERNYGIGPELNLSLAFPKADPKGPATTLLVNDRALGTGAIPLVVDVRQRSSIPELR